MLTIKLDLGEVWATYNYPTPMYDYLFSIADNMGMVSEHLKIGHSTYKYCSGAPDETVATMRLLGCFGEEYFKAQQYIMSKMEVRELLDKYYLKNSMCPLCHREFVNGRTLQKHNGIWCCTQCSIAAEKKTDFLPGGPIILKTIAKYHERESNWGRLTQGNFQDVLGDVNGTITRRD